MPLVLAFALLAAIPPSDVASGLIGGKAAIMLSPVTRTHELIDPVGCEVHVVSDRGRGVESRAQCGAWFLPGPTGDYLVWLEQGNTISVAPAVVRYSDVPFGGRGAAAREVMVPAGFVTLPTPSDVRGADSLRLIVAEREGGLNPFERRVRLEKGRLAAPVRMPEGAMLSGLYDKDGNALALSPPVRAVAGRVVEIAPTPPPPGTGAVLFSLARPHGSWTGTIELHQGERSTPPDALQQSAERVIAIWYSVRGASAELHFEGDGLPAEPVPVEIVAGKVTTVRRTIDR